MEPFLVANHFTDRHQSTVARTVYVTLCQACFSFWLLIWEWDCSREKQKIAIASRATCWLDTTSFLQTKTYGWLVSTALQYRSRWLHGHSESCHDLRWNRTASKRIDLSFLVRVEQCLLACTTHTGKTSVLYWQSQLTTWCLLGQKTSWNLSWLWMDKDASWNTCQMVIFRLLQSWRSSTDIAWDSGGGQVSCTEFKRGLGCVRGRTGLEEYSAWDHSRSLLPASTLNTAKTCRSC